MQMLQNKNNASGKLFKREAAKESLLKRQFQKILLLNLRYHFQLCTHKNKYCPIYPVCLADSSKYYYNNYRREKWCNMKYLSGHKVLFCFVAIIIIAIIFVFNSDKSAPIKNETKSANELALTYEQNPENDEAVKLLYRSAQENNVEAMFKLAQIYEKGLKKIPDQDSAKHWYLNAAINNYEPAQFALANILDRSQNYSEALKWYKKSAENGNTEAMATVSFFYSLGKGVFPDEKEAFTWLQRAAERGHTQSMAILADMYVSGEEINKDLQKAFEFYSKAAEQGDCDAAFQLAEMYENGICTKQNSKQALIWYEKSAESGNRKSMIALSKIYKEGKLTTADATLSEKWHKKARDFLNETDLIYICDNHKQ